MALAAREGGAVAGNARKELETKTGTPVISRKNYLNLPGTTSAQIGINAFIETQTDALVSTPENRTKARRRVAKETAKALGELGGAMPETLPVAETSIQQIESQRKKLERKK